MTTEKGGRPTVMTPEAIAKLEAAFSEDNTILDACFLAGISKDSYYDYLKANPWYSERVEYLRNNTIMHARKNLVNSIKEGNVNDSKWYLERKKKDEFSTSSDLNVGGQAEGVPLNLKVNWCDKPTE
jgi:hypothetical protein